MTTTTAAALPHFRFIEKRQKDRISEFSLIFPLGFDFALYCE